jgi:hypothetical protein
MACNSERFKQELGLKFEFFLFTSTQPFLKWVLFLDAVLKH